MGLPSASSGSRLVLKEGKGPKQHDGICSAHKPQCRLPLEMETIDLVVPDDRVVGCPAD